MIHYRVSDLFPSQSTLTNFYLKKPSDRLLIVVTSVDVIKVSIINIYCATSRKVAGSIPDGVTGIFRSHNLSARTMVLGSTQPLDRNENHKYVPGVKVAGG